MIAATVGFLLTAFFGLVTAHIPLEKGVLVLDDHNFDDAVAVRFPLHHILLHFYINLIHSITS
jgi:hypothetical protein